ncbi:unnamed protein product [Echinostoma caproni]|uniref:Uncharacterized protein n=1 Tax=Echinostoma caproni TaxID=27848 RepID=A0A3P8HNG9_9TREM|nr:unnamed protein product [Echinostoma caproni]
MPTDPIFIGFWSSDVVLCSNLFSQKCQLIVVTGFGPFENVTCNPSSIVVDELKNFWDTKKELIPNPIRFVTITQIPVTYKAVEKVIPYNMIIWSRCHHMTEIKCFSRKLFHRNRLLVWSPGQVPLSKGKQQVPMTVGLLIFLFPVNTPRLCTNLPTTPIASFLIA